MSTRGDQTTKSILVYKTSPGKKREAYYLFLLSLRFSPASLTHHSCHTPSKKRKSRPDLSLLDQSAPYLSLGTASYAMPIFPSAQNKR
jgi:hypothetical protein